MFRLDQRTALVTGASGGIGSAIARALHAQGAHVMLAGRRRDALEALAGELEERTSILIGDLTAAEEADRLIQQAESERPLHTLVNNAGITKDTLALRMKDDDWQTVIDTNLSACFRLSRSALKGMVRRRYGRIVNIGSVVGTTGNPGQANYAAAKAGLVGMTKALAAEVAGRGITVNCLAPGMITTAMTDALTDKQREQIMERIPAGRLGTGEDVAAGIVYLVSDASAYVTGQTLHVNGGMAMI